MKDNKKLIIVGKDSKIFKDIEAKVKQKKSDETFTYELDRKGITNGLGDLGRDGKRGGTKKHAIYDDKRWEVIDKIRDKNGVIIKLEIKVT